MANDANIIKIKRSGTSGAPSSLKLGELAYSYLTASGNPTSNGGDRLFIGANGVNVGTGNANDIIVIGGKYFTDLLDHERGVLTASSALIVNADKKLDELLVDNLSLNDNTLSSSTGFLTLSSANNIIQLADGTVIASGAFEAARLNLSSGGSSLEHVGSGAVVLSVGTSGTVTSSVTLNNDGTLTVPGTINTLSNGNLTLSPNGTGLVSIAGAFTLPRVDGTNGYVLTTNGAGVTSWQQSAATLNISGTTGTDGIDLLTETLAFAGATTPITVAVTDNTVTVAVADATSSTKGLASFDATDFTVTTGAVTVKEERIQDIIGAMVDSNNESNISVTYDDPNGKLDFSVATATSSVLGVASFDATDFTVTAGAVTVKEERIQDIVGAMVSGTETDLAATYDDTAGTLDFTLATVNTTVGTYGSSTAIPVITVNAKGLITGVTTASISGSLSIAGTTGTDTVTLGTDTLTFAGSGAITTAVTDNQVAISVATATSSIAGVATFNTASFDVTSGDVTIKLAGVSNTQLANSTIYIGTTQVTLGDASGTTTSLAVDISGKATTAGNADTVTNGVYTTDTGTVTNTMLQNSTISGVSLGGTLSALTDGTNIQTFSFDGSSTATVSLVSDLVDIDSISSTAGTGDVVLVANSGTDKTFTFGGDGSLELPAGGLISESTNAVVITPSGATSEQKLKIYPTAGLGEGNHIHLASGDLATTSIFLGSDSQYVRTRTNGGMEIGTGVTYPDSTPSTGYHWIYGTDGTTQFPNYTFPAAASTTAGYVLTDVAGNGVLSWQAAAASFTVTGTTGSETLSLLTDSFNTVSADTNLSVAVTKAGTTVTSTITLAGTLTGVSIDGNAATVTNGVYTTDTGTVTNTMLANSTIYIGTTQVTLGDASGTTTSLAVDISGKATTAGTADQVANSLTFATSGGTTANSTFNGSTAVTIDYSTLGAAAVGQTFYIGSTAITLNQATGTITSLAVDISGKATTAGNADTVTNGVYTTDTGTVTNTMLAGSIDNSKLSNSTISGVALGSNLYALSEGANIAAFSFDGSGTATVALATTLTNLTQVDVGNLSISGSTIENSANATGDVVLVANNGGTDKTFTFGGDGTLNVAGKITGVATPTDATDAANKAYVDATRSGLDVKASVRATTTANITLSNTQTIDGVALTVNDRVLVKNQTAGEDNGIYVVASGAWTRAEDADNSPAGEVTGGMFTFVEEGSTYADSGWVLSTDGAITLGSTSLTFVQFSGAGQIVAGAGLSKTGNTLDVNVANGIEIANDNVQLASSVAGAGLTYTTGVIDIVGTTDRISVGTDSIDISANYVGQTSITTLGTITTGTWSASTIATTRGGTGLTAYATGDLLYASASDTLSKLTKPSATSLLTMDSAGAPTWAALSNTGITGLGTVTAGTWNANTITYAYGGTGQTTYAKGDLLYASAADTLSKLSAGTNGQTLQLQNGLPVWGDLDGGTY